MDAYTDVFTGALLTGAQNYDDWKQRNEFLDSLRDDDDSVTDKKVFLFLLKHTLSPSVREHIMLLQSECLKDPDQAPALLKKPLEWLRTIIQRLYKESASHPTEDALTFLKRRFKKEDTAESYVASKTAAFKKFVRSSFPKVDPTAGEPLLLAALTDGLPRDISVRIVSTDIASFTDELPRLLKIFKSTGTERMDNRKTQQRAVKQQCNFCGYHGHTEIECRKKASANRTLPHPSVPTAPRSAPGRGYSTPRAPTNPQGRRATPATPYKPPAHRNVQTKDNLLIISYNELPFIPLTISVGGKDLTIDAIIDTGAAVSCINDELWQSLSAPLSTANRPPLLTATGAHAQVIGHSILHATSYGNRLQLDADIKFHVLKGLNVPLILGWADLKHWDIGQLLPPSRDPGLDRIQISSDLPNDATERIRDAMNVPGIFSPPPSGATVSVQHTIPLTTDVPVARHPYKLSHEKKRIVEAEIADLLEKDIIEPCHSPYASPVLIVPKKDGTHRMVLDYRALNDISQKRRWPLPRMSEILDSLSDAKFISRLDLKHAFYQIPLAPEDRHKTAFVTSNGQYQFKRMPFGLHGAPSTFQRSMDELLADLKEYALPYLDDIIVFSNTFDEHCRHLNDIATRLSTTGFYLKPEKCILAEKKTELFGFIVGGGSLTADPGRVKAIAEMAPPTNRKEVMSFLGTLNYYRKFIQDFAAKSLPIVSLTSKEVNFEWGDAQQAAFEDLKQYLLTDPILQLPRQDVPFLVRTDASDRATGAVLLQELNEMWMPVAYYSYKLNKAERNYSTTQKEGLAVVKAITHWDTYLDGVHFDVETDHSALTSIYKMKEPNKRLARWVLTLQAYDFEIRHRPGVEMHLPDALSRLLLLGPEELVDLKSQQRADMDVAAMIVAATNRTVSDSLPSPLQQLLRTNLDYLQIEDDGLLVHLRLPHGRKNRHLNKRAVVPSSLRHFVLDACHSDPTSGHLGFDRTYERLAQRFWWPDMWKETKHFVSQCSCQVHKRAPALPFEQHSVVVGQPWKVVSADHLGPLPSNNAGHRYILVFVDYFTRWTIAVPVHDTTADTTARVFLQHVVYQHGVPNTVITDNGTAFANSLLTELSKRLGVNKLKISPGHPQTNGKVERWNHTVTTMLRSYADDYRTNWPEILPAVTFAYNTSKHSVTGHSPYFLNHGVEARLPVDVELDLPASDSTDTTSYAHSLLRTLVDSHAAAQEMQERLARAQERRMNKAAPRSLTVGQQVYIRHHNPADKLAPRFQGPFPIIATSGLASYVMETPSGPRTAHIDRLKVHQGPPPVEDEFPSSPELPYPDAKSVANTPQSLQQRILEKPSLLYDLPLEVVAKPKKSKPDDLVNSLISYYWESANDSLGWYTAMVIGREHKTHILLFADGTEATARLIGYPARVTNRWELLQLTPDVEDDINTEVGGVTEASS